MKTVWHWRQICYALLLLAAGVSAWNLLSSWLGVAEPYRTVIKVFVGAGCAGLSIGLFDLWHFEK
jgi:hypothetical protein